MLKLKGIALPHQYHHGSVILSKTFRQPGDNGKGENGESTLRHYAVNQAMSCTWNDGAPQWLRLSSLSDPR